MALDSKLEALVTEIDFTYGDLVADQYPSAVVLGVDLSLIQPFWVAPNTRFLIDDIRRSVDISNGSL